MEAGSSRMNDLTVIQASQVRDISAYGRLRRRLFISGIVRIRSQKCGQRDTPRGCCRSRPQASLRALGSSHCCGFLVERRENLPSARLCSYTAVCSTLPFPQLSGLNLVYSVPFSVGALGAACGVMITGMQVTVDAADTSLTLWFVR